MRSFSAVMLVITALRYGSALGKPDDRFFCPSSDARWLSAFSFLWRSARECSCRSCAPFVPAVFCYNPDDEDACPVKAPRKRRARCESAMRFGLGFLLSINNVGGGISAGLDSPESDGDGRFYRSFFNVLCLCGRAQDGQSAAPDPGSHLGRRGLAAATMVAHRPLPTLAGRRIKADGRKRERVEGSPARTSPPPFATSSFGGIVAWGKCPEREPI